MSKELVERLRARTFSRWEPDVQAVAEYEDADASDAADLIERQSKIIEDMRRFLSKSFPTCVADSGQYYVRVNYLTLKEAQSAYSTLGDVARTLTGDTK